MPQFYINSSAIDNNVATITGNDARHIINVLRLKVGNWLVLTDGIGHRWKAEIVSTSSKEVKAKLKSPLLPPLLKGGMGGLVLAQALIKHDRFEWIIQKAVELGCSKIIPFTSERTIPKFLPSHHRTIAPSHKSFRWQKIADEAAKQCGTVIRPVVEPPTLFLELLKQLKQYETTIMFYEGETKNPPSPPFNKGGNGGILIIIGPEGGFSSEEVAAAKNAGAITCGLGPLILRVETAAIAGLTLVQDKLGYFNPFVLSLSKDESL